MQERVEITPIEGRNGYQNINITKQLKPGQFIVAKKKYKSGKEVQSQYGTSYLCQVEYNGDNVGMFLKEKYHPDFESAGDAGDDIKIGIVADSFFHQKQNKQIVYMKPMFEVYNG